ncbi:MAG: chalcone isomerase [Deltaproteobacteria bacterium HGW-Deltaproteobacteria-13]|nr:MAG: chalcone isomerase [Deltaproteobacteria bacterium HGW-Deltaproteobacteria-13]
MFKKLLLLCSAILILTSAGYAKEVGGINMPDSIAAGNETLILNGAGVRTKFFIKAYVGGLYLNKKSGDANAIMNANEPMAIKLHMISKLITSEKMKDATLEGFFNSTNGNTAPYKDKIDTFISVFKDNIKIGDVYDIIYIPAEGTKVYKNKELKITTKGLDFKKVLFGIWLCDKPADKTVKAAMLGK